MEIAILALGCFWGPEQKFSKIDGIIRTEVGYCGGNTEKTTYKDVCTGATNHAEVVKLEYDEKTITYEDILKYFFEFHDPTTLNSQGYDFGTQYRSEIFYLNEKQKMSAEKMIEAENKKLNGKVVTQLSLLKNYCTAAIKKQWGENLGKFEGMQLPGGVTLNGRQLIDDAKEEIEREIEKLRNEYDYPPNFFIG